jgi:hypothetical protein
MSDHSIGEAHRDLVNGLDLGHIAGHVVSLGSVLAVLAGLLPVIAAFGAVVWYAISIYETKTVQRWLRSRRRRKAKRAS